MAENRESVRGEGTQVGAEPREPQPDNEVITRSPEETVAGPAVSASGQAAGDSTTEQPLPGEAATTELNPSTDGNIGPSIEPAPAVVQTAELPREEADVSGEVASGEGPGAAPAGTMRPQVERGARAAVAAPHEEGHGARKVLVGVLLVLTCIGLLSSVVSIWMNQTLLNTDRWVQIVGPVAQDPQVVAAVSAYAADQTVAVLNVQQRVQAALPDRAAFLAVPITQQVHDFVQRSAAQGMNTPAFQRAWIAINTALHKQIVAALRGQSQFATISNGKLTIDLVPLIGQALHRIQEQGPGIVEQRVAIPDLSQATSPQQARQQLSQALGINIPENFGQVEVMQSDQLTTAQQAVRVLDTLVIVLPLITLALLVATIWLSVNRRRTLIELGIGIVIVFVLTKILIAYFEQAAIAATKTDIGHAIAQSVIPAALDSLVVATTWLLVLGVVLALVAYLVGQRQREWLGSTYGQVKAEAVHLGRTIRG